MNRIIFYILLLFPVNASAQIHGIAVHRQSFVLDSLILIAKDTTAYINKIKSITDSSLLESDLFFASKIFAAKKMFAEFRQYAVKSMEKGQPAQSFADICGRFLPAEERAVLFAAECAAKQKYFERVPPELFAAIKDMVVVDARIRELNFARKINYSVVRCIDSVNLLTIRKIINTYGMLTEARHGSLFNNFFYLIIHCCYYNNNDYTYMRDLFLKAVMAGEAKPDLYTYYVDRWVNITTNSQLYGAFANQGKITDAADVDKRRSAIGACSLQNWFKIRKAQLTMTNYNDYKKAN